MANSARTFFLHMAWVILASLLAGCAMGTSSGTHIPGAIAGEWVTPDFTEKPHAAAAMMIWIFADGKSAWCAGGEVGEACTATYDRTTNRLSLQNVLKPGRTQMLTTYQFEYDPNGKTLTLVGIEPHNASNDPMNFQKMKLQRHKMEPPPDVLRELNIGHATGR